jgi:hypothetical protein
MLQAGYTNNFLDEERVEVYVLELLQQAAQGINT